MRVNYSFNQLESGNGVENIITGIFSGPIVLSGNPTKLFQAAPKQYVDSVFSNLNTENIKLGIIPVGRMPSFSGDVSGAAGTGSVALNNTGVGSGSYAKVTVDSKGRITVGENLVVNDIPDLNWNKVTTGKPITLSGYGITNALNKTGDTVSGEIGRASCRERVSYSV